MFLTEQSHSYIQKNIKIEQIKSRYQIFDTNILAHKMDCFKRKNPSLYKITNISGRYVFGYDQIHFLTGYEEKFV